MTHAKPIPMVIIALYQNDVQFGEKSNAIYDGKMHNKRILRIHLSSVLSGSKLLWSI